MWLTCDQAVLLRQLSRSPRKKKNARLQVTRETTTWEIPFFFFYSVHFVYFIWRNSWQPFSFRWTNMRLFPPFFPKSESKVLPRLAIEGRIVAFSLDTYGGVIIHVRSVAEKIHKVLLRNIYSVIYSITACRWRSFLFWFVVRSTLRGVHFLLRLLVGLGWSGVPTRYRTIWIFKVKCSRVTFLPADCRNVAFFTTHTSLVFRYLL